MAILYYIFTIKVWFLSKLPLRVLYVLSGLLNYLFRDVFKYRREVIMGNLRTAFPEKSEKEREEIARQFYRHLSDIIIEIIKWRSISRKEILSRYTYENHHLHEEAFARGQSVILAIGHCGNWEWMGTSLGLSVKQPGFAIVKPLSDKRFNAYMEKLRHRFNAGSTIPFKETYRTLARNRSTMQAFYVFAADQTPTRDEINYWGNFFNQETGFFLGIEKIAKALDFTVLYLDLKRVKRGHYKGVFHLITDDPKSTAEYEITDKYIQMLESSIRANPADWLWSHRRWKHKKNAD